MNRFWVRARAPARVDFAGGWTDVPPYCEQEAEGGAVVNAAIGLTVETTVMPADRLTLVSEDLGQERSVDRVEDLRMEGGLDLLAAAARRHGPATGRIVTRATPPPGSGLGSSGALGVTLIAALSRYTQAEALPRPAVLAEMAYRVESEEARHPGGRQDQYAAALGGFHALGFRGSSVTAHHLVLDPAFREELGRRAVLCYTGTSRVSGRTIARVMAAYEAGRPAVRTALGAIREVALGMQEALLSADLARVGALLTANWTAQQALDPGMRTPVMANLETALGEEKILGCKAVGAGAGGCMFFLAARDPERLVARARASGAQVLPLAWREEGVEVESGSG